MLFFSGLLDFFRFGGWLFLCVRPWLTLWRDLRCPAFRLFMLWFGSRLHTSFGCGWQLSIDQPCYLPAAKGTWENDRAATPLVPKMSLSGLPSQVRPER